MQSLLQCAATAFHVKIPTTGDRLTLCSQNLTGNLPALALRHRLVPQVARNLTSSEECHQTVEILRQQNQQCILKGMLLKAELVRIAGAFSAASIPLVGLKGPIVERQVYPDGQTRQYRDLDLLVPPEALVESCRLLRQLGFGGQVSSVAECPRETVGRLIRMHKHVHGIRYHGEHPTVVELHWRVGGTSRMSKVWNELIWENPTGVSLGETRIDTLQPHALIVFLAWHGGRHRWKRLSWLCDFGHAVQTFADTDWHQVIELATNMKLAAYLALAFRMLHDIFPGVAQPQVTSGLMAQHDLAAATASCRHAIAADELYYENQPLSSIRWYFELSHCITDRFQSLQPLLAPNDDDVIHHGWLKGRVNRVRHMFSRLMATEGVSGSSSHDQ